MSSILDALDAVRAPVVRRNSEILQWLLAPRCQQQRLVAVVDPGHQVGHPCLDAEFRVTERQGPERFGNARHRGPRSRRGGGPRRRPKPRDPSLLRRRRQVMCVWVQRAFVKHLRRQGLRDPRPRPAAHGVGLASGATIRCALCFDNPCIPAV